MFLSADCLSLGDEGGLIDRNRRRHTEDPVIPNRSRGGCAPTRSAILTDETFDAKLMTAEMASRRLISTVSTVDL